MKYTISKSFPNILSIFLNIEDKIMCNPENILSISESLIMKYESQEKTSNLKKFFHGNKLKYTYIYNNSDDPNESGTIQIIPNLKFNNLGFVELDEKYILFDSNRLIACSQYIVLNENKKNKKPLEIDGYGTIFLNCYGKLLVNHPTKTGQTIIQDKALLGFKCGSQYERLNPYQGLSASLSNIDVLFYKLLSGVFILDNRFCS